MVRWGHELRDAFASSSSTASLLSALRRTMWSSTRGVSGYFKYILQTRWIDLCMCTCLFLHMHIAFFYFSCLETQKVVQTCNLINLQPVLECPHLCYGFLCNPPWKASQRCKGHHTYIYIYISILCLKMFAVSLALTNTFEHANVWKLGALLMRFTSSLGSWINI